MNDFLMKPKIDFAFKEIMANETARTGFLAAVLELNPESIKETVILNTFLRREHEDDKQGILDVRLRMDNETEIDIEIQLSELNIWADRSLFYLAKMFTEQIKPGESYRLLKKCVSISILDFVLFNDEANFYSCFHIMEDTRHFRYTDKMEFHVIELPKLPEKEDYTKLELWAKFINAEKKEEFDMLAEKNAYIGSAYQHLQVISQDEEKRLERLDGKIKVSLLAKYGYTEVDAAALCKKYGLYSPAYEFSARNGCWFCPNCRSNEFAEFKRRYPDLWQRLLDLGKVENLVSYGFKYGKTIEEVDRDISMQAAQMRLWE